MIDKTEKYYVLSCFGIPTKHHISVEIDLKSLRIIKRFNTYVKAKMYIKHEHTDDKIYYIMRIDDNNKVYIWCYYYNDKDVPYIRAKIVYNMIDEKINRDAEEFKTNETKYILFYMREILTLVNTFYLSTIIQNQNNTLVRVSIDNDVFSLTKEEQNKYIYDTFNMFDKNNNNLLTFIFS